VDNSQVEEKAKKARARRALQRIQRLRAAAKGAAEMPAGSEARFCFERYGDVMRDASSLDFSDFVRLTTAVRRGKRWISRARVSATGVQFVFALTVS
jgi:hypothetical protein